MAVTADKVVVVMEAQVDGWMRDVGKAQSDFAQKMTKIGADADAVANKMSASFDNAAGAFVKAGKGADQAARGVKVAGVSAGAAQQQMRNLAFQFQDIGTMLAAGQSPFMLLAQQLPQVTMYGGQLGGVMGALRATVASLVSPLGLATTGFVLLASAAIDYFSELMSREGESAEAIKKQIQLVGDLAEKWGDILPALKAYSEELKRAQEAAELQQGFEIDKDQRLEKLRDDILGAKGAIGALVRDLQDAGEETSAIIALQDAFNKFSTAANDGKAKTKDVERVTQALTDAINSTGLPALADFKDMFDQLAAAALGASDGVQAAAKAVAQAQSRMMDPKTWRSYGRTDQNADGTVQGESTSLPMIGPTPESRPSELGMYPNGGWKKGRSGQKKSEYERETQQVKDRTAALQAQTAAQAGLNPLVNDYGFTVAQAKAAQELLTAAQKSGTASGKELKDVHQLLRGDFEGLSPAARKQAEAMLQMATNYGVAVEAAERFREKQAEIKKNAEEALNTAKDVVSGMIDGFIEGEKAADIFANSLKKIGKALIDDVLNNIFSIKNASSGGWLDGIFSLFGGGGFNPAGKVGLFDSGGYTGPGGKYQPAGVVHKGEYVFDQEAVRKAGGPAALDAMRRGLKGFANGGYVGASIPSMLPSSGAISVDARTTFNASGNRETDNEMMRALARRDAELPALIIKTVRDAQKRRGL